MQFRYTNALAGYLAAPDALTARQRAAFVEIVFCCRLGDPSATAVFSDIETLSEVAGQVPDKVTSTVGELEDWK